MVANWILYKIYVKRSTHLNLYIQLSLLVANLTRTVWAEKSQVLDVWESRLKRAVWVNTSYTMNRKRTVSAQLNVLCGSGGRFSNGLKNTPDDVMGLKHNIFKICIKKCEHGVSKTRTLSTHQITFSCTDRELMLHVNVFLTSFRRTLTAIQNIDKSICWTHKTSL